MDDVISCSVCLRTFEDPRLLPCKHTFCLKPCLEKLFDSNFKNVKCPLCRAIHSVPKGVGVLPKNVAINVADKYKTCVICKEKISKPKNCECCLKEMCINCYNSHLQKTKEDLLTLTNKLKRNLSVENGSFHEIRNYLSLVESKKGELNALISHRFHEINSELYRRKSTLIDEVTNIYQPIITKLKGLSEIKEIDIAVLRSAIQSAADCIVKENISQGHLLSLQSSIQNTLSKTPQSDDFNSIKIKSGHFQCNAEAFKNSIMNFGEIKWSTDDEESRLSSECRKLTVPERKSNDTSSQDSIVSETPDTSASISPMSREKTFLLTRPAKPVSFDIPISAQPGRNMKNSKMNLEKSSWKQDKQLNTSKPKQV